MDKDAWNHTWSTLTGTCARLEAELAKCQVGSLLKGLLPDDNCQGHAAIFKRVTDAKAQLVDLQQLVIAGEGQANTAFIAALSDRITSFTQQLNSIKQQQRGEYAALLQEEQQLLEELSVLELTLTDGQQQCGEMQEQAGAGQAQHNNTAWQPSCSRLSTQHDPFCQAQPAGSRRGSDSAADCVCRSPDRPGNRQPGSVSSSPVKGPSCAGGMDSSGLPPEVQAYDLFLARHGDTGGWHPDDHNTFMALLKAHRGDYNAALAAIVDALPLQTRKSVIAHCRWHADLCELDMRKRIALVNWRTAKEAAKAALRAQAAALGDTASSMAADSSLMAASPHAADQQQKESLQLKQQLVQQWKQEQAAAREEAARAAQEQLRLQQQQERQQRQQRQEELRRQLQEAKAAKQRHEQELQESARQAQQAHASGIGPEQKQRLQQRNDAALERQRQLRAAKQAKQEAKERAQQQLLEAAQGMRPRVDRDPSRLLSTTTAAAARAAAAAATSKEAAAAQGSSRGRAGSGFVLHVSHKATPNWAAGVPGL